MKIWHVQAWGAGFLRQGAKASFELSGIVAAATADEAFKAAIAVARNEHPELGQALQHYGAPGPVINPEEIQEVGSSTASAKDAVEVFWTIDSNA